MQITFLITGFVLLLRSNPVGIRTDHDHHGRSLLGVRISNSARRVRTVPVF